MAKETYKVTKMAEKGKQIGNLPDWPEKLQKHLENYQNARKEPKYLKNYQNGQKEQKNLESHQNGRKVQKKT